MFSLIKSADTITLLPSSELEIYEKLSKTLDVDMMTLIENDQAESRRITDEDYKQWLIQVVMALPSVTTSRNKFADTFLDVLENDPAGKVNLGNDDLVDRVVDLAWAKYQVIMKEINHKNYEEEEEIGRALRGELPSGMDLGSEGEPASSSQRGVAPYQDDTATDNSQFTDNSTIDQPSSENVSISDDNNTIAELIKSTRELIDTMANKSEKTSSSETVVEPTVGAVEDEEVSQYNSKRAELIKKYDAANAAAKEAQRQAQIKSAQAKQLDRAVSDLDKEIIKRGEVSNKK